MFAGRSAVNSCSKTALETSCATCEQTEPLLGGATMNSVSMPPIAIAKLAPISVSVEFASCIVRNQLPAGVRTALEPDADVVHHSGKG